MPHRTVVEPPYKPLNSSFHSRLTSRAELPAASHDPSCARTRRMLPASMGARTSTSSGDGSAAARTLAPPTWSQSRVFQSFFFPALGGLLFGYG